MAVAAYAAANTPGQRGRGQQLPPCPGECRGVEAGLADEEARRQHIVAGGAEVVGSDEQWPVPQRGAELVDEEAAVRADAAGEHDRVRAGARDSASERRVVRDVRIPGFSPDDREVEPSSRLRHVGRTGVACALAVVEHEDSCPMPVLEEERYPGALGVVCAQQP